MRRTSIVLSLFLSLVAVPLVSGCSSDGSLSNPAGDDDDDGGTPNTYHFDADGYVAPEGTCWATPGIQAQHGEAHPAPAQFFGHRAKAS